MITFKLTHAMGTSHFFDRREVMASMTKARRRVLSKAGAWVRTAARSSLRRRKKPSSPGSPPSVHADTSARATLKKIYFAYDPINDSVVIGPEKLNQVNFTIAGMRTSVPNVHEFGGNIAIREWMFTALDERTQDVVDRYPSAYNWVDTWTRRDLRWKMTSRKRKWTLAKFGVKTRVRNANYPARPFMRPALKKVAPQFPDLFRNAIQASRTG